MHPYIAIEIDGVLSPYKGPLPAGHSLHDVTSAAWKEWAAMVSAHAAPAASATARDRPTTSTSRAAT
ncbi:hypothetical protein ACGFN1_42870 [Streptomyces sp. NPDC048685]|uniref:hypothetical protein n=1 Tax=unclassified Streptomyces TaxID=2593676 RepID=UPI0036537E6C